MNILHMATGPWACIHTIILMILFSDFIQMKKRLIALTYGAMAALFTFVMWFYYVFGSEKGGQAYIFISILPSVLIMFPFSKYHDGRFFFSFFISQTIAMEIVLITNILNYYITPDTYVVMFVTRIILYPLAELAIYKWLRKPYLEVLRNVEKGWWLFSVIAALLYILMNWMFNFPTAVTSRGEYLMPLVLLMIIVPLTYWHIFLSLLRQLELHLAAQREQLLMTQSAAVKRRAEDNARHEKKLAIERHDLRHRLRTIDSLLAKNDAASAIEYIAASVNALSEAQAKRWCENPVLDAVFGSYLSAAEGEGIRIESELDIPKELSVDASELSTVFANALENAITAVKGLPAEKRFIRCKCIRYPQLMFRVTNPYEGDIAFDEEHRPVTQDKNHGLGIRSIDAYCEKHGAYCDYIAENGLFSIQIVQP